MTTMMINLARNRMQATAAALRATLRRWLRPAALLLLVVIFALLEPLTCIIHCQLAIPAQAHQHHKHSAMAHAQAAASSAHAQLSSAAIGAQPQSGVGTPWCFANFSPADSAPDQFVPSSPVHEVVLTTALALLPFLVLFWLTARPIPTISGRATIPPTPPPRHQVFA